ncbi:MAG: PQQ-dependent sugar dehydrogenase [Candidatus Pacebacteria bacterium]|nr:PQQ-dependent sugar dehydrogenase [Candidatus Paceibacterota bacterium]
MTKIFIALIGFVLLIYGALVLISPSETPATTDPGSATTTTTGSTPVAEPVVIADELAIPWDIAFLQDGSYLVTERPGDVLHISSNGSTTRIKISTGVAGEGGLLGLVLHPDYARNHFVYVYMSEKAGTITSNRVVRYTYEDEKLDSAKEIIKGIPGALYHDGGRMEFGPDGKLYITTGDATRGALAQDKSSLAGKILRLNDDGTIPSDNPFDTAVYSYGHRNPQGLAWDESGQLWETEHGPTGEAGKCCRDEINKIVKGGNYGWPTIIGDEKAEGLISPAWHSGDDTWAPASLVYHDGALYFGGLIGTSVYKATLSDGAIKSLDSYTDGEYGRIRTIRKGPDSMFYITTSNTDGRGRSLPHDDRIIRFDPRSFE